MQLFFLSFLLSIVVVHAKPLAWREIETLGTSPSPRLGSFASYDQLRHRLLIYGGATCDSDYLGDAFALDLNTRTWSLLNSGTVQPSPIPRAFLVGGYSSALDAFIITSGEGRMVMTDNVKVFGDTWLLNLTTNMWSVIAVPIEPNMRYGAGGGLVDEVLYITHGFDLTKRLQDTSTLDISPLQENLSGVQWQKDCCSEPPAHRCLHGSALTKDKNGQRILSLFGGCSSGGWGPCPRGDSYVLKEGEWEWQPMTRPHPSPRMYLTMVEFPNTKESKHVLLGGCHADIPLLSPLQGVGGEWKNVDTKTWSPLPLKRTKVAAAAIVHPEKDVKRVGESDDVSGYVMMFGGEWSTGDGCDTCQNTVWVLEGDEYSVIPFPWTLPDALWYASVFLYVFTFWMTLGVAWWGSHGRANACARFFLRRRFFGKVTAKWFRSVLVNIGSLTLGQTSAVILFGIASILLWLSYFVLNLDADDDDAAHVANTTVRAAAKASGRLLMIFYAIVLFPISRWGLWNWLFGQSFDRAVRFHRWLARTALIMGLLHGVLMPLSETEFRLPHAPGTPPLLGFIGLACSWIAGIAGISYVRRAKFELFYYLHPLGLTGILVSCFHQPMLIYYIAPGLLSWIVDRVMRVYRGRIQATTLHSLKDIGGNVVELEISKASLRARKAGEFVFVCVPCLSRLEWHPVSICSGRPSSSKEHSCGSCPKDSRRVHLCFQAVPGNKTWTRRLLELSRSDETPLPKVLVDGPHGGRPFDLKWFDRVLMIAGGIGITPINSLLHELSHDASPKPLVEDCEQVECGQTLEVVFAVRKLALAEAFLGRLAPALERVKGRMDVYCTRKVEGDVELDVWKKDHEQESDLIQWHQGRPLLDSIIQKSIKEGERLVVVCCGPKPLVEAVHVECTKRGVYYHPVNFIL